jgi:membrane protein YqaA with SNARE-associated domain
MKRIHVYVRRTIRQFQKFIDRFWFTPLLSLLAALDSLIIIIPTDGLLISSTILKKQRWWSFALAVAIGSSLGALVLVSLSDYLGLEKILEYYPGLDQSHVWQLTMEFFKKYGIIVVFIVGLTPFSQQPALIIAGLIHNSFFGLSIAIFVSRIIKYLIMAYIASHAPKLLNKMWGLKDELVDSGIKLE